MGGGHEGVYFESVKRVKIRIDGERRTILLDLIAERILLIYKKLGL